MAERKIVSLLFADLCGSTALVSQSDPEEAQVLLDRTLKTMAEAVETYGGSVRRLQGDGIVGLFGAPVAQEDHALRACLAALTLQRRTREAKPDNGALEAPVRVGIHSGEVVVGSINDLLTSHHRVDGAALHLAARLEQLAQPGSILVSGATARLLDGGLSLRPLGPREIRGFDRPVELFELAIDIDASESAATAQVLGHLPQPLLGRDSLLEKLLGVASRVAQSRLCVLGLRGEAGIGKTRLLAQLADNVRAVGFDVCSMTTRSYTNHLPYSALADLMRALMRLGEEVDPWREREAARQALATWPEAASRHLPAAIDLLDLEAPAAEWLLLTPNQRRHRIGEALLWLIATRLSQGPLMIVVEDVFLADRDSLRTLEGLWRKLDQLPVLLCFSYRQDFVHRWADPVWFEEMGVGPLTQRDMIQLAESLLGTDESLQSVVPVLLERADGNPFYLEQMSLGLADAGAFDGAPGHYRYVGEQTEPGVPASIAAVIGARVDRLPAKAKGLLEAMAILNAVTAADMLARMLGDPEDEVVQLLRLCMDACLLQRARGPAEAGGGPEAPGPDTPVRFQHALVQEVVAAALTRPRRKQLHQTAFRALCDRLGKLAAEQAAVLAHHAYAGGLWAEAAQYAGIAMVRSVARSANRDALRLLDTGLDAAGRIDDEPTRLNAELALRTEALGALLPLGQFDAMFMHLERAQAISAQMGSPKRTAAVALQQAVLYWARGMPSKGLEATRSARAAAAQAGSRSSEMTAALVDLLLLHCLGRYRELVAMARDVEARFAVELSSRRFMPGWATVPSVHLKVFLADALMRLAEEDTAQAVCDQAYAELAQQDHAYSRALVDFAQTSLWLRQGRFAPAAERLRDSFRLCQEQDVPTMTPCIVGLLSEALGHQGRLAEAQDMVRQTLSDKSYQLAGLYSEFYLRYGLGQALAAAGRHGEAMEQFGAARDHASRHEQWGHVVDALLAMGLRALHLEQTDAAMEHLQAARQGAAACGMVGIEQRSQALMALLGFHQPADGSPEAAHG
ncbi:ATP-binding protein [Hydrogenophaga sp. A37]|uniref:ATP-binding protein n=1 Tax=Hydrogenophaga sp. A37 TaxID=1945864 RepID=UPI0009C8F7C9|nr:adenylate/guanylate cyclase domain-containing protein [Hydrogenophaga sp. A37]OOG84604.1 hypothetical protein B0E41_10390 [Hydrogenophaga sp. A37]